MSRTIVFYVSGHGFGHASRSIEVINALLALQPDLEVIVRTAAARWLFDLTVRGRISYQHVETDTGIVQIDSLRLDQAASVQRAREFMSTFDARIEAEAGALEVLVPGLVLSDMPPLGVAAGARLGAPTVALGNFTWDWVYSAYPGTAALVEAIGNAYAMADLAIRYPMWGGFGAFTRVLDVPFVARRSTRDPAETRRALAISTGKRLVLPSFGGHGLEGLERPIADLERYDVLWITSKLEHQLYAAGFRYEDLVRAADVVVTKPGYGIIAECLANDTALLYTDRGHFIEYDVLVASMPRLLRTRFIPQDDLLAGRWQEHLDALLAQPGPNSRPRTDGAEVAATILLDMM